MARPTRRPMRPVPLESADAGRQSAGGAPQGDRFAAPRSSFGPWLRGQREARNVALAEIAEVSKISLRYLEALEQDRFEVLPAPVFVRGFLREYARIVGLDPDEVVNLYLVSMPRPPAEKRNEPTGTTRSMPATSNRAPLVVAGVLLVLALAAGLAYWLARRGDVSAAPQVAARVVRPPTVPPLTATTAPSPAAETPVPLPDVAASAPAPLALPLAARETAQTTEPAAGNPQLQLLLEFQQDCWVEVRIDDGRRASELRAGGETMTLEATDAIVLTLGNASVVRAELNGRPLALPVGESKLLRDFRIDRSMLGPAPPSPPAGQP